MNNDRLNTKNEELVKQLVKLAGTESPSEGFITSVMQRIESAPSANQRPKTEKSKYDIPIIRPIAWLWAAMVSIAIIAISYAFAPWSAAEGKISLPDLPRVSNLFLNAINSEPAQIFALVVIITSSLFMLDIALSRKKPNRRGGS